MVLARAHAATVIGIHAFPVEVEVDLQDGLPSFATVGLPDAAVRESRDRVRAALINSGFPPPEGRVTVSLAPADLRKEGSGFDLAIAVGLLAAAGRLPLSPTSEFLFIGELIEYQILQLNFFCNPVTSIAPSQRHTVADIKGVII